MRLIMSLATAWLFPLYVISLATFSSPYSTSRNTEQVRPHKSRCASGTPTLGWLSEETGKTTCSTSASPAHRPSTSPVAQFIQGSTGLYRLAANSQVIENHNRRTVDTAHTATNRPEDLSSHPYWHSVFLSGIMEQWQSASCSAWSAS